MRISTAPAGAVGFGGALTLLEFARTIGGGVEFFWAHAVSRTRFSLNSVAVISPLPRSIILQRSLQNGRQGLAEEYSVSVWQTGQGTFMMRNAGDGKVPAGRI